MTKGYILVEVDIPDMQAYRASGYMDMAEAAIAKHGGRFLVRSGNAEIIEGSGPMGRIVILEFPSRAAAATFFHSDDYAPALALRQSMSNARGILLDEYAGAA